MTVACAKGKIDNVSVRDVPLLTNIFSVYVVGRNFEETDEAGRK